MELSVFERLTLLQVLPIVGEELTTLFLVRELQKKLGFTEEEHEQLKFQDLSKCATCGSIFKADEHCPRCDENTPSIPVTGWNESNETPKEVDIGEKTAQIVRESIEKIPTEAKDLGILALYEKFGGSFGEEDDSLE